MKPSRSILLIFSIALLLASFYFFLIYSPQHPGNEVSLYGNVDVRQVNLGFRVPGRITKLYFEEGDLVQPGQLMAELETQPYSDQLVGAQAARLSATMTLANAETLLNRRNELIKDGSVSQEDLDNALTQRDIAAANLEQAVSSLKVAEKDLKDTKVYCPSVGIVLSRILEPGTVVRAADPAYALSITDPVWIRAYVPESYLGWIVNGMTAEVHTDTPGIGPYTGTVGFISPLAEFTPKTVETSELRTQLVYRIRVYINKPDQGLRQGMPVTVKIRKGS